MNTIKNNLILDFADYKLHLLFFYYHQMNPTEVMYFWNNILKILDETNVLQILGFLLDLQENSVVFPRYAQKSLNFHVHQINKKIFKKLPKELTFYIKNLKLFKFALETKTSELQEKIFEGNLYFIDQLHRFFLRTPTAEIKNAVENYFNLESADNVNLDITKKLLDNLKSIDTLQKKIYVKHLCLNVTNPSDIVDYVFYNMHDEDSIVIMEFLFLHNKQIYDECVDLIYKSRKYHRIELISMLPECDINKFDLKEGNLEILQFFLLNKPLFFDDVVTLLKNKISKKNLISFFVANYELLKDQNFDFDVNDLLTISTEQPEVLYAIYKLPLTESQKYSCFSLFKTIDEDFIVDFLKINSDKDLVLYILTNRQLKYNLKTFIIDNYKKYPDILYKLFIYLDKNKVKSYIDDMLVDAKSLEYFLLVFKPTDILVYAHEMTDVAKSIKILDLCFSSSNFNENDFVFTLNMIEGMMPPLIVRTLILTFKRFPHLKSFTINYLFKLISRNAINDQKFKLGIIKCLEIIGYDSIDIVAALSEDKILAILEDSKYIRNICHDTFCKSKHNNKREHNLLRETYRRHYFL